MSRTAAALVALFLSSTALAAPPTNPQTAPAAAPAVHDVGTVTALDTTTHAITIQEDGGQTKTWHYASLTLDKAVKVGAKVDIAHVNGSAQAESITIATS